MGRGKKVRDQGVEVNAGGEAAAPTPVALSAAQRAWLQRGLDQPGGKLPLFDAEGRRVPAQTVQACLDKGVAEPWFANPLKPDWLVCKLTPLGRLSLAAAGDHR